jgi:formylglycine-generating enzyme required for sulfatase activity
MGRATTLVAVLCATAASAAPGAGGLGKRVAVPAGPFVRGSAAGPIDERPARSRRLPAFAIDRTEVTRGAYARCLAAGRCKGAAGAIGGPRASTESDAADAERLPVTDVSWAEARDYCRFVGGRLPTEDEWEKAARGPDGREYPWGTSPDDRAACERANWGNFDGEGPCAGLNPGRPVAVGSYPQGASPYGALDMGGNVWEWVADRYDDDSGPERRVVRGGSCCSYFVGPRAANRNAWAPDHRDGDLGFRCAYGGAGGR